MRAFSQLRLEAYASDVNKALLEICRDTMPHGWPVRYRKPAMDDVTKTEVPPNMISIAEPIKRSITGAGVLGSSITDLIAAIKSEVDSAYQDVQNSALELREGINSVKSVSKALKGEAADIKSKLGQFSNMGPE